MSTTVAAFEDNSKESICSLCLSYGRILMNIGENYKIYQLLAPQSDIVDIKLLICWECRARLQNIQQFRLQVATASEAFISGQLCSSLSRFCTSKTHMESYVDTGSAKNGYIVDSLKVEYDDFETSDIDTTTIPNIIKNNDRDENLDVLEVQEALVPKTEEDVCETDLFNNSDTMEQTSDKYTKSDTEIPDAVRNFSDDLSENDLSSEPPKKITKRKHKNMPKKFKKVTCTELNNEKNLIIIDSNSPLVNVQSTDAKFKCEDCDFHFDIKMRLTKHNKFHDSGRRFFCCNICSRGFTNKISLTEHIRKHRPLYVCKLCNCRTFSKRDWSGHMDRKHVQRYECLECGQSFESEMEVKRHIKAMHHKYICDHCGIHHWKKSRLEKHMTIAHSTTHKCKICGKSCRTRKQLSVHQLDHRKLKEPLYCVECDLKFYRRRQYHSHNYNCHSPQRGKQLRVPCPECGKLFYHTSLKDHRDFEHLKLFKYRCEKCNKIFRRRCKLKNHVNRYHLGITPPKNKMCTICGRGFAINKVLINHMRTHTGERPYECECGAAFAQQAALMTHKKSRHKEKMN